MQKKLRQQNHPDAGVCRILCTLVFVLAAAIFVWIVLVLAFHRLDLAGSIYDVSDRFCLTDHFPNVIPIGMAAAAICLTGWAARRNRPFLQSQGIPLSENASEKKPPSGSRVNPQTAIRRELLLWGLLLVPVQILLAYGLFYDRGADVSILRQASLLFAKGEQDAFLTGSYFSQCPNQLLSCFLLICLQKAGLFLHVDGYLLAVGLSVLCANFSVLLSGAFVYRLTEKKSVMRFCLAAGVLVVGLSPYIVVPYTDMLSAPLPVLFLLLWFRLRKSRLHPVLRTFLICLVPLLGYQLKALNAIPLIAVGIAALLDGASYDVSASESASNLHNRHHPAPVSGIRFHLLRMICAAAGFVLALSVSLGMMAAVKRTVGYKADKTLERGVSWYLLIGSSYGSFGGYNMADEALYAEAAKEGAIRQTVLPEIKDRYLSRGLNGNLAHFANKTLLFYGDGTFGTWQAEGMIDSFPERTDAVTLFIRQLMWPPEHYGINYSRENGVDKYFGETNTVYFGRYFVRYAALWQILWMSCLLLTGIFLFSTLSGRRREDGAELVLSLIWTGLFFFFMLFENSPRLIVSFLPVLCVTASLGMFRLSGREERSA